MDDTKNSHNHLAHMQVSPAQKFYNHNLPAPKLMMGIGQSKKGDIEKTKEYTLKLNEAMQYGNR